MVRKNSYLLLLLISGSLQLARIHKEPFKIILLFWTTLFLTGSVAFGPKIAQPGTEYSTEANHPVRTHIARNNSMTR